MGGRGEEAVVGVADSGDSGEVGVLGSQWQEDAGSGRVGAVGDGQGSVRVGQ